MADWAQANGLELNEKKTKVMITVSILYFDSIDINRLPKIIFNGTSIQYVDKMNNLGVAVTPTLNSYLHVGKIESEVYGALRSVNFHRRSFSFELKKILINK